jgi:DNA-binding LacI/PurR family transcriptional regulator
VGGRFAAERIFAAANPPAAAICSNDLTAVGMLHMAHQLGRKIPEDLSLIGFDDFVYRRDRPAGADHSSSLLP